MMDFPLEPGAYRYRALRLAQPKQFGWDVYALQTALNACGASLTLDGYLGNLTDAAIRAFQHERSLENDGVAGVATQQKLTQVICRRVRENLSLPNGIPYGHAEQESGTWLGNHTAPYANGSRDCGVVQRNTQYAPMVAGFDAPDSIQTLGRQVYDYHSKYLGLGVPDRRAWELACGSWNAPAWTDRLARGESLSDEYRARIESYIASVTKYVRWD
jgi:hypothetical protein